MRESKYVEGLEIDQDLRFQQRMWVLQRLGWSVMACIILAALVGLLGSGPLASRTLDSPQRGFRLEYQRFLRHRVPTRLLLQVKSKPPEELRVWYDRTLIEHFIVTQIVPAPTRVEVNAERLTYIFRVAGQEEPSLITFSLEPETFGSHSGRVGIEYDSLYFQQFVYP
jgi:hypothetical protein